MKRFPKMIASKFTACSLAAVGVLGLASTSSQAAVVTVNPANYSVPNSYDGLYINFVTQTTGTSEAAVSGYDFDPYSSFGTLLFYFGSNSFNGGMTLDGTTYANLSLGSVVGPTRTFIQTADGSANETAAFQRTGSEYLGVRFTNEATGQTDYGYVHLSTTGSGGFPVTVLDYAYENTGLAITVVPEPSTSGAIAIGASALAALLVRRRRSASLN